MYAPAQLAKIVGGDYAISEADLPGCLEELRHCYADDAVETRGLHRQDRKGVPPGSNRTYLDGCSPRLRCPRRPDYRLADDVLDQRLALVMHRPAEQLRERLAFGPAEVVVDKLAAFGDAGVQQVFIWPVVDEIEQLQRFSEEVMSQLDA